MKITPILFFLTLFGQCLADTRNILLIGNTGNGKSTIANVLVNKNGNFEEVFEENKFVISGTSQIQVEKFTVDGIDYQVIDTVGIGDNRLSTQEVLNRLVDAKNHFEEGLNQILFVTSGKFTDAEKQIYDILKKTVFDEDVNNYITIVRNRFPYFHDSEECKKDKESIKSSDKVSEVILSCNKFIHVDTPPVDVKDKRRADLNKEDREYSRMILLTHLRSCQGVYKPNNLGKLKERTSNFKTSDELNEELKRKNEEEKAAKEALENKINKIKKHEDDRRIEIKSTSSQFGGYGGGSFNDWDRIKSRFGGEKNIRSLRVKKIIVRSGYFIDSLQFFYNIQKADGSEELFAGDNHGKSGGGQSTIYLDDDEKITKIAGKAGRDDGGSEVITKLFFTTSKKYRSFSESWSGEKNTESFDIDTNSGEGCVIFGRSGKFLDAIGVYVISKTPSFNYRDEL